MVLSVNTGGGSRALTTAEQIGIRDEVVIGTMPAGRGNLLTGAIQQALAALGTTILFATIGDSIANVSGTTALHNWRAQSVSGNALNPERDAAWLQFVSGGALRLVANCGVSGDNTTQLLARDNATVATNRRAIIDAANLGAQDANGSAGVGIEFDLSVYGATPLVSMASGDLLGSEALLIIDNGTEGGAPTGVFSFSGRTRMWYAAGASNTYVDGMAYDLTAANQVNLPGPIKGRLVNPPMPAPDTSANMTSAKLVVFAFSRVLQPFRVLVSEVGAVKLPAGF